MPTHGIRPPAAKEHTLLAHRTLRKGEFSVDIPRDLVTRHGPYKVLNPSEALLLAGICSLNPGKYYSKSRLFKAAGMDINQGRNVLARLVEKGFILEVGHSWKAVIPERDEQPTAEQQEQPTAKKEEKEEAAPTTEQPPTAKKAPRPVKVNQGEALPANAPSPEELAEAWNKSASWSGDPEYGYPVVQEDVEPEDFTPAVIRTLMFHASTNDTDPTRIMKSVVCYSNYPNCKGLDGKGPAYVIGTVTDNEAINRRFYDSSAAIARRKEKREEEQQKQWEADAPLREAEAAREKAEREEYERRQQEKLDAICTGYTRACEANDVQPDLNGFREVITAKYPKSPRIVGSLSTALFRKHIANGPMKGQIYADNSAGSTPEKHAVEMEIAEKLSYALCMLVPNKNVPTFEDLDRPFVDQLDKVLEARIN